jgi:putative endonuclease
MDTTPHHRPLHLPDNVAGAALGRLGEDVAARHLVADDGLEIIARNWRLRAGELRGELDLVAIDRHAGCVVVCEVKTRRDAQRFGGALAAVSPRKRGKVRALAATFLRQADLRIGRVRLDVIAVDVGRRPMLHHVPDAL